MFQCAAPSSFCNLYEDGGLCKSTCDTCGNACQALRVTDRSNLEYYYQLNCTIIFGTLYITSIPDVLPTELFRAYSSVSIIRGDLVVEDNPTIVSLDCFANLINVDSVYVANNPSLVDARLSLTSLDGNVYVSNNVRLCPSNWPSVSSGSDEQECAFVNLVQLLSITQSGNTTLGDIVAGLSLLYSSLTSTEV